MANGVFVPGTGDLKSTTLPNAILELALSIQTQERIALANQATVLANNLTVPNNVVINIDLEGDTASIAIAALPITMSLDGSGNTVITAVDYLAPIDAVIADVEKALVVTGSDLNKTNKVEAFLELCQLLQLDEAVDAELDNRLTMTFNLDAKTASINASFPITPTLTASGNIQVSAVNYLA